MNIQTPTDLNRAIRTACDLQDNFASPETGTRRMARLKPPASLLDSHAGDVPLDMPADDDRHPDARLIALGREHERLVAVWLPLWREMDRLSPLMDAAMRKVQRTAGLRPLARGEFLAAFEAASHASGHHAACEANNAALDEADAVANQIRAIPAQTLAGVLVKARVLMNVVIHAKDMEIPNELQNWDVQCFLGFIGEIERLAAEAA